VKSETRLPMELPARSAAAAKGRAGARDQAGPL
jgi:hypothetical protein